MIVDSKCENGVKIFKIDVHGECDKNSKSHCLQFVHASEGFPPFPRDERVAG